MGELKSTTFRRVQSEQTSKRRESFSVMLSSGGGKVLSLNSEVYRTAKTAAASALTQRTSEKPIKR